VLHATVILWLMMSSCYQGVGNAPPVDGGSPNPLPLTFETVPGADLPVGVEVKLTVNHAPVNQPTYFWGAVCANNAARTEENWNQATITDCPGSVGIQTFTATVRHTSPTFVTPSSGSTSVTWNKPDGYDLTFGPGISKKNPNIDYCVVTVCPTYKGQKIGKCALICASENVRFYSTHPSTIEMEDFGVPPIKSVFTWWPVCGYGTNRGFGAVSIRGLPDSILDAPTWAWKAPCLEDVQATIDLDVTNIPVGTELGYIERYYRFSGPYCDVNRGNLTWTYRTPKLTFHLKVVLLPDGTKAAIYSM
jgi:hypothetical protein